MDSTVVLVQARMGSQRLPGKVLADLCGAPVLAWLLERVRPTRRAGRVVVATSTDSVDDAVVALCDELGFHSFRGHPTDVLKRFADATRELGAQTVVRLSADSPFLDHETVDTVLERFEQGDVDLAENHTGPGWPVGTAVEAVTAEALLRMDEVATAEPDREHVTQYAYEHPDEFRIAYVPPPAGAEAPGLRLCVDTSDDLERVREICGRFGPRRDFTVAEVAALATEGRPA